jgi:hypothetical protein
VPPIVDQAKALFRALCAEGAAPRLRKVGGGGLPCGQSRALEELGLADVRAFATLGDPLRAITALDRAERTPATRTPARASDAQGWIVQAAPVVQARAIRPVSAVPKSVRGGAPSWGALAFDASGMLLVRTAAGVVRVEPELGDESDADGVSTWPSAVASPDGSMRWIEAYDPCDAFALRATFAPTGEEGDMRDLPVPVPPPLASKCAKKGDAAQAIAFAWGTRGLEAVIGGEPVLVAPDLSRASPLPGFMDQPSQPGAPRSPNGRLMVVATSQGLLVRSARSDAAGRAQDAAGKPHLLRAKSLDGAYTVQTDCAVSNDGTRVACVQGGRAWVGLWDAT